MISSTWSRTGARLPAHPPHGGAIAEQPDIVQLDDAAGFDRPGHRVGVLVCTPTTRMLGLSLHVAGDSEINPATADGDEHGIDRARVLAQNLHRDGALPGDHIRVIERMDEDHAVAFHQSPGLRLGVAVAPRQDDLPTPLPYGVDL